MGLLECPLRWRWERIGNTLGTHWEQNLCCVTVTSNGLPADCNTTLTGSNVWVSGGYNLVLERKELVTHTPSL